MKQGPRSPEQTRPRVSYQGKQEKTIGHQPVSSDDGNRYEVGTVFSVCPFTWFFTAWQGRTLWVELADGVEVDSKIFYAAMRRSGKTRNLAIPLP